VLYSATPEDYRRAVVHVRRQADYQLTPTCAQVLTHRLVQAEAVGSRVELG
jgi:hypothetical protein